MEEIVVERFIKELAKVGGEIYRAEHKENVYLHLAELVQRKGVRSIARGRLPDFDEARMDRMLRHHGMEVILAGAMNSTKTQEISDEDREKFRQEMIAVHMGISTVDYGIAETGTLVFFARQARLISALPPIHVAMMKEEKLVASWDDFIPILRDYLMTEGRKESCVTFITGPSRTADIELSLTVGVHGPGELHVVMHP